MTKAEFLRMFEETVLVKSGTLTGGEHLDQLDNWDSMSVAVLIVRVDAEFQVSLSDADLRGAKTVTDLYELLAARTVS